MSVNITIEGEGLSLNKETNLQKAGQIIAFLGMEEAIIAGEPAPVNSGRLLPLRTTDSMSPTSAKEALLMADAKTNAHKITVLGKFISDNNQDEGFLIKELQLVLKKLGDEPGNFTRDLKKTISLQYIVCVNKKDDRYEVTERGLAAIQGKFTEESSVNKTKQKTGSKKMNIASLRDEIKNLTIASDLTGFPGFHKLPTKADCILWILAYADSFKVDSLSPAEVEYISDKLRKKIEKKDFSAHNKKNIKESYVSSNGSGQFKLQYKGSEHLKMMVKPKSEIQ